MLKQFILWTLTLTTLTVFAQHKVSVVNNTEYTFQTNLAQTGTITLPGTDYTAWNDSFGYWQPLSQVLQTVDSSVQVGDTAQFKFTMNYGSDSLFIEQRITNTGGSKTIAYRVTGSSFSDPWYTDQLFHDDTIMLDTTQVIIRYKADRSNYSNLTVAIHKSYVYSLDAADFSNPNVLNIMAYNIQILWIVSQDWAERASSIPQHFSPYQDVVIFEEAFVDSIRNGFLIPAMEAEGFNYNSGILNDPLELNINKSTNGGVIIFSRWPIVDTAQHMYSTCSPGSSDCLAAKGVKYASINKLGKLYHIFGTHIQAGGNTTPEKHNQFRELRSFVDSMYIPADEPVIIAGDMNQLPVSDLRDSLNPIVPNPIGHYTSTFNVAGADFGKIIDHIWASSKHLAPVESYNKVITFRDISPTMWGIFDLSDHRTATARFEYPGPTQATFDGTVCPSDSLDLAVDALQGVSYSWYKNGQAITVSNNALSLINPGIADTGTYTVEADYSEVYGAPNDSLTRVFYPNGPDTINSTVTFEVARVAFSEICGLGISSLNDPAIRIYPTVSDGIFYVDGLSEKSAALSVYNFAGQLLATKQVSGNTTLDLTAFPPGMYLVHVLSGNSISVKKVIVE